MYEVSFFSRPGQLRDEVQLRTWAQLDMTDHERVAEDTDNEHKG